MKISDKELEEELSSARAYAEAAEQRKAPPRVVTRAKVQVELLEELILWRENGRKWLQHLNSKQGSLSDTVFAGKEKNGKV